MQPYQKNINKTCSTLRPYTGYTHSSSVQIVEDGKIPIGNRIQFRSILNLLHSFGICLADIFFVPRQPKRVFSMAKNEGGVFLRQRDCRPTNNDF